MADHFKLETVLRHRKHLEENAHKVFSQSRREWEQARNALNAMTHNQQQYRRELKNKMAGDTGAGELRLYHRYLGRLEEEIAAQNVLVEQLAGEKEEKRALLLVALKNRKMIEKLKERYLENAAHKAQAEERKRLDESAMNRYQSGPRMAKMDKHDA